VTSPPAPPLPDGDALLEQPDIANSVVAATAAPTTVRALLRPRPTLDIISPL
jgi:hypothetical protein